MSEPEVIQHRLTFTLWWYRLLVTGVFGFFTVLLIGIAVDAGEPGAGAFAAISAIATAVFAVLGARSASVVLTSDAVVIRTLRTRRIAWEDIRSVDVGPGSSVAFLRWRVPYFEMTDGSIICADEMRSRREPSIVDDIVEAARSRMST